MGTPIQETCGERLNRTSPNPNPNPAAGDIGRDSSLGREELSPSQNGKA